MKKYFIQFVSVIVLSITLLISMNAQTIVSESSNNQKIDIDSKAQELGISSEQLQGILNSTTKYGGGDPVPEAMQERFFTGETAGDVFGYTISSAGDVNGDGYDDIIVGAPNNDAGGSNAGRAYIYFGGNIINQVADVILTGATATDLFGTSVSGAGDVNGDSFSDVIVGATGNDAGGSNAGRAYIFFGGTDMNNVADVLLTGAAATDNFGYSVSEAGDVNGDGYTDVIVGAINNDAGGSNAGRVYIYFGGAVMDNIADVTLTGELASDNFGNSVSAAGDVNGDGYSDVIVGAALNDGGGSNAGRAYIYFGGSPMNNTADLILTGAAGADNFGISVSDCGDVNGDGYYDVIVGAYLNDAGGINAGRAYIYFGGVSMNNTPDVLLTGTAADDWFGFSVSTAGDINGDGYSDAIVGAHMNSVGGVSSGRVFVYYGGQSMDNIQDAILTGETADDQFGFSVSNAGDVNGDGYSDILVGANLNDGGGSNAGRAYLYLNSLTGIDIPDEKFSGEVNGDGFGYSVSNAGDVNGDGYQDLIISAPLNDTGGSSAGRVYIYLGGQLVNNIADLILTGEAANDQFGYSVSTAGDVNGDGFSDIIVGAPGNDAGGSNAGKAYIYFGGATLNNIADLILTGETIGNTLGISVSNAGDVNGDGYSDVIVGGDGYNSFMGRAYIYLGGIVMDNSADIIFTGQSTGEGFGGSVSSAGDVNGDGYSDVLVGAKSNDGGALDAGRVYIYLGGSNMNNLVDVILTGEAEGDWFGGSVSNAGDVNGDGYSDVIVGSELNDGAGNNSGRIYIYFGGFSMDNNSDIVISGATDTDQFGYSVSEAGDVNDDGYSDVIVGTPSNDIAGNNAGRSYIYFGGADMDIIPDIISTGFATTENHGFSVSGAGDVNGDGIDDLIVGGPFNSTGNSYLYLSSPPLIKPSMKSIKDIPLDQGGFVRVKWNRSGYDIPGQNRIAEYILQRSDPPGTSGFVWDYVATIPAIRAFEYSYVSPTPSDSFSNSSGTFYFRVIARGTSPDEMWYSNIIYGHSVDNLSPSVPLNFYAAILNDDVKLGWKANTEFDLLNYVIYRTDVDGANPDTLEIFATIFDTTFIDTNPLSGTAYYFLKAQDVHNNLSTYNSASISNQTTFALSVNVSNGWNMVSVPGMHPVDQNVNTWWQFRNPLADVYRWTTTYEPVTTTSPTQGYWMLHSGSNTYNTGDEWPLIFTVPNNPINVNAGWNMIGGYENFIAVSSLTTTPPGLIVPNTIYGWNGTYYNAANLEPGLGYWILLNGNGVINISTETQTHKTILYHITEKWGSINITDANGKNFVLYAADSEEKLNHYLMPPLPPEGSFDIRYSTGRKAEILKGEYRVIEMRALQYPITVLAEGVDLNFRDETGKIINVNLKSGEKITINNEQVKKILVTENITPYEFSLKQNYPNPFNPTTTIRYTVADAYYASGVPVRLIVYDVLGNEIITLVNENKPAGHYDVQFNAEGLSSGVYFYKLSAGSFSDTKKLMLVK